MSSSYVNALIQMLIMYYNQIFLDQDIPAGGIPVVAPLAPHLISLKQAQEKHGSVGPAAGAKQVTIADALPPPPASDATDPVSPRKLSPRKSKGDLKAEGSGNPPSPTKSLGHSQTNSTGGSGSGRRTLAQQGRTMTADSLQTTSKSRSNRASTGGKGKGSKEKKDGQKRNRNTVLVTESTADNRRPSMDRKSFYETLKAGTLSLAATLLEEQDLQMEVEEVERLSGESRVQAEERLRVRLEDQKKNNRNLKRAQRTSRKLRDSTFLDPSFTSIFKQYDQAVAGKEPVVGTPPPVVVVPATSIAPAIVVPPPLTDISSLPPLPNVLPVPIALDDDEEDSESDSDSDSDSEETQPLADLPPPPAPITDGAAIPPPLTDLEDTSEGAVKERLAQNIAIKAKISDVVEAVADGDIDELASFMGQMKKLSRMERQKSKNVLLQRMQIKRQQTIEVVESDSDYSDDDDSGGGVSSSENLDGIVEGNEYI